MERCLPENIKEKIWYKQSIEKVWRYFDNTFVRPDTFLHDLMQLVNKARAVLE
jgi:hypothetical protein